MRRGDGLSYLPPRRTEKAATAVKSYSNVHSATKAAKEAPEREAAAPADKASVATHAARSHEDANTRLKAQLLELHHAAVHLSIWGPIYVSARRWEHSKEIGQKRAWKSNYGEETISFK